MNSLYASILDILDSHDLSEDSISTTEEGYDDYAPITVYEIAIWDTEEKAKAVFEDIDKEVPYASLHKDPNHEDAYYIVVSSSDEDDDFFEYDDF